MFKEVKKSENPNNNEGNEQVNNNKQQNNANPTTREMNMIQVNCCKQMFTELKKIKNINNKQEMNT
jgi:hypothetical protein